MFQAHKTLYPDSKRSIDISSFIDSATLTKLLGIVAVGTKFIFILCVSPISVENVNVPTSNYCLTQSRERYFPFEIMLTKDTTLSNDNFKDSFSSYQTLTQIVLIIKVIIP